MECINAIFVATGIGAKLLDSWGSLVLLVATIGRSNIVIALNSLGASGSAGRRRLWGDRFLHRYLGSLFGIEVVDQHILLLCIRHSLLLVGLDKTVDAAMERVDFIRVNVIPTYSVDTIVAKFDVILSNFCWIGTLPDPVMAVLFVVSDGEAIVEQDGARRGRFRRRSDLAW